MADFPNTKHKMLRAGYVSLYVRPCSRCRQQVERFRTRNGKEITMDVGSNDSVIVRPHVESCAGNTKSPAERLSDDLGKFLRSRGGLAIVMLDTAGARHWIVSNDAIPGETKDSIVSAAFEIKQHLERQSERSAQ